MVRLLSAPAGEEPMVSASNHEREETIDSCHSEGAKRLKNLAR